jgi:hypothetical protein
MATRNGNLIADETESALSWGAVIAGSTASAAITLLLLAFGIGVGFSVVSPWTDSGISATTFTIAGGIYLIVVAMLASTIGGYLAGRLRSKWNGVHEHERYFRDSAHGFMVWAVATVVSAAVLGGAFTHIISGASAGLGAGVAPAASSAAQGSPSDVYVDNLLRADPAQGGLATAQGAQMTSPTTERLSPSLQGGQYGTGSTNPDRGEITRILAPGLRKGGNIAAADRTYLVKLVSARTGLPQAEAEQRVNQVVTRAKDAADAARKSTAMFSIWLVVSMLAGALSASLAAIEGGNLRNREWYAAEAYRTRAVAAE